MSDAPRFGTDRVFARAADGSAVVVLQVTVAPATSELEQFVDEARVAGARAIWILGGSIEPALGFVPTGGYVRLEAPAPPTPLLLRSPPADCTRELQATCFAGMWGRYEPVSHDPATAYVGLYEMGRWVGICQVASSASWIDGPGVHPILRTPERSVQLVRGAASTLPRDRPVTLETWGESGETVEAYHDLGFEVVERLPGWALQL